MNCKIINCGDNIVRYQEFVKYDLSNCFDCLFITLRFIEFVYN